MTDKLLEICLVSILIVLFIVILFYVHKNAAVINNNISNFIKYGRFSKFKDITIVSSLDGRRYKVIDQFNDHMGAANRLAELNQINKKFLQFLKKKYLESPSNSISPRADSVRRLINKYNENVIIENYPKDDTDDTAYVLGKGDLIAFCLRNTEDNNFHDINTLTFVDLHELSHIITTSYDHNDEFWTNFKWMLQEAVEAGLYKPVDYSKHPIKYCGLTVSNSPYFT